MSEQPNPKPGERWSVTRTGPDPEPAWAPGDLVQDARGDVFKCVRGACSAPLENAPHWLLLGCVETYGNTRLARPLRRLVPEGGAE